MNNALRELYQTYLHRFAEIVNTFPEEDLQGPLLMAPSAYFEQATKLMIVGQETGGWHYNFDDIDEQQNEYRKFNVGEAYRASPFWNITRKVESALCIQSHSCAWTNLNRFDQEGGPPSGDVLESISKLDFLVRDEIRILAPEICIFFTNRKYDQRLIELYPACEFLDISGLPASHFARLSHPSLPARCYRTPHPRTIRTRQWEDAFVTFIESSSSN